MENFSVFCLFVFSKKVSAYACGNPPQSGNWCFVLVLRVWNSDVMPEVLLDRSPPVSSMRWAVCAVQRMLSRGGQLLLQALQQTKLLRSTGRAYQSAWPWVKRKVGGKPHNPGTVSVCIGAIPRGLIPAACWALQPQPEPAVPLQLRQILSEALGN